MHGLGARRGGHGADCAGRCPPHGGKRDAPAAQVCVCAGAATDCPPMLSLSFLEIAYCCVVIVMAYAVRGSTGFGAAAAMPLLALVVPLKILVPVWTLLGAPSSVAIVAKDYRHIAVRELLTTLPAGLIGVAIGLTVFAALDTHTLAQGLGALVVAYGCYALRPPTRAQPDRKNTRPNSPHVAL